MPSWMKSRATAGPARTARRGNDINDINDSNRGYPLSNDFEGFMLRQDDVDRVETVEEILAKSLLGDLLE